MKHLFSFSLMLVLLLPATAHDFEVDGIYYNQFYNNEAEVTHLGKTIGATATDTRENGSTISLTAWSMQV